MVGLVAQLVTGLVTEVAKTLVSVRVQWCVFPQNSKQLTLATCTHHNIKQVSYYRAQKPCSSVVHALYSFKFCHARYIYN